MNPERERTDEVLRQACPVCGAPSMSWCRRAKNSNTMIQQLHGKRFQRAKRARREPED